MFWVPPHLYALLWPRGAVLSPPSAAPRRAARYSTPRRGYAIELSISQTAKHPPSGVLHTDGDASEGWRGGAWRHDVLLPPCANQAPFGVATFTKQEQMMKGGGGEALIILVAEPEQVLPVRCVSLPNAPAHDCPSPSSSRRATKDTVEMRSFPLASKGGETRNL